MAEKAVESSDDDALNLALERVAAQSQNSKLEAVMDKENMPGKLPPQRTPTKRAFSEDVPSNYRKETIESKRTLDNNGDIGNEDDNDPLFSDAEDKDSMMKEVKANDEEELKVKVEVKRRKIHVFDDSDDE
jgi:hypothetical protein